MLGYRFMVVFFVKSGLLGTFFYFWLASDCIELNKVYNSKHVSQHAFIHGEGNSVHVFYNPPLSFPTPMTSRPTLPRPLIQSNTMLSFFLTPCSSYLALLPYHCRPSAIMPFPPCAHYSLSFHPSSGAPSATLSPFFTCRGASIPSCRHHKHTGSLQSLQAFPPAAIPTPVPSLHSLTTPILVLPCLTHLP